MSPAQAAARLACDAYFARLEAALTEGRRALLPSPATAPGAPNFRRRWAAACHAELEHARRDWRRLVAEQGAGWCHDEHATWGAHPSERYRLEHEWGAAAVVGAQGHLQALESGWREAKRWRPIDRAYLGQQLARRSVAWAKFLVVVARYRAARAKIDPSAALGAGRPRLRPPAQRPLRLTPPAWLRAPPRARAGS